MTDSDSAAKSGAPSKKQYGEPALVAYGSISKLTQDGEGSGFDAGPAGMTRQCL